MFELRIIFWGLTALVPAGSGDDMIALMPSASVCAPHVAAVAMLEGECRDGTACFRGLGVLPEPPFALAWLLDREDLSLSAVEPVLNAPLQRVRGDQLPDDPSVLTGLRWLPRISQLASGAGRDVEDDCLPPVGGCEQVHARFRIGGGELGTCHFLHTEDDGKDQVHLYSYQRPDETVAPGHERRAVADAVAWTMTVDAPSIGLGHKPFAGSAFSMVELYPVEVDGVQRVTLLVLNQIVPETEEMDGHFGCHYQLAEAPAAKSQQFQRESLGESVAVEQAGFCEDQLDLFDQRIKNVAHDWGVALGLRFRPALTQPPHSAAECDMVLFEQ